MVQKENAAAAMALGDIPGTLVPRGDDTLSIRVVGGVSSGKTAVAAVIAKALSEAFPNCEVNTTLTDMQHDEAVGHSNPPRDGTYIKIIEDVAKA